MKSFLEWPQTALRKAQELSRRLWVRVLLMGGLALLALALTQPLEWLLPEEASGFLAGAAADRLLNIIANAMLAVTTFSLTVMVSVYFNASAQWTPRIHRLAMEDPVTQNTIAAFIGAYVFALTAIILRELQIFSDDKGASLFIATVFVLVFIVWNLIRWTLHLQTFGSLLASSRQIEQKTCKALLERRRAPCFGGHPLEGGPPEDATAIRAPDTGYVQYIYPESLQAFCERMGVEVFLTAQIGTHVSRHEAIAYWRHRGAVDTDFDDDRSLAEIVCDHILVGDLRSYSQDPRFGLVVMAEIASKALSPGVNDPGTAVDVLTRIERVLADYEGTEEEVRFDRLHVRPLSPDDLVTDAFAPIARDGAGAVEVQIHLQRALGALTRHPDPTLSEAARRMADESLDRALEATTFEPDRVRLRDAHADGQNGTG
ncbi:MAG: DUF2254 domain-containing protein [Shimia sp.]